MNPITGEKIININGIDYVMRFTWRGLSEIEHKYGDNPNLFDPETIANVAAIGLRDRHEEMTAERIMDLSPPLIPFAKSVQMAIQWAYFGAEAIPKGDDTVKKNLKAGGLSERIKTLLPGVFRRLNFGG